MAKKLQKNLSEPGAALDLDALYRRQMAVLAEQRASMTYEEMRSADDFDGREAEQNAWDDMPASDRYDYDMSDGDS